MTLHVPRLRNLPFETQIIERYRRRESSVEEALVEMYLAGVSVRRVEDITEALWGTRVSPSTVSELNQKIYEQIETWRNRPIAGRHAYVYLDGIWLKRSWGGEVKNVAVLVAIGVREDGYREILGVVEGVKEDTESWRSFLRHLKERGLTGVRLIVSDKCLGLVEAVAEFYPQAAWQRCMVHWYRNVMSVVPKGKVKEVVAMLKAIHAQEDRQAARSKAQAVVEKLEALRLGQAATIVRGGLDETLSYMSFPREHWTRIRTNNVLERIMRRDSPADARGGQLPGRQERGDVGGGPPAAHRGHEVGPARLPGHVAAERSGASGGRNNGRVNWRIFIPPRGNKDRRRQRRKQPVPATTQNQLCAP